MGNTDWQPIETATKDNETRVLLWFGGEFPDLQYIGFYGWNPDEYSKDNEEAWRDPSDFEILGNPTHWMPLPSPPESKPNYYVSDGHESENEIASTPGGIR